VSWGFSMGLLKRVRLGSLQVGGPLAVSWCCATNGVAQTPPTVASPAASGNNRPGATELSVSIHVDADKPIRALKPIWRFFGYDEPNFTYQKDGQKLLTELNQLGSEPVFIRTHHLLTSGDGASALKWGSTGVYSESPDGSAVYDWTILDRIFDTWRERGLKPFVEIGFMPEALSTHPQDYPHHPPPDQKVNPGLGFSYPPRDYSKWRELCFNWASHCLQRYGAKEVEQWRWEVWNEPNIFYWKGSPEEYHKLYDFAVDGIRRAIPSAHVGGPHTAGGPGGQFLRNFLAHCVRGTNYATGVVGSPLDFVAFHAKGSPTFENGHVRMGIANELQNVDAGFATVASFPELREKPIVIGECDPEGCAACQGAQLGYRNGTMYSSYTAASFARLHELAQKHGANLEGALTWAFEFENQPYFAGFRVLASNGIDLPVLNVFRMFGKMSGTRLTDTSSAGSALGEILQAGVRGGPEVSSIASLDGSKCCVLVWHYHDDDIQGPEASVELSISGLPWPDGAAHEKHYRIDSEHSNSFEFWKRFGSPQNPTPEQYAQLEKAGQLAVLEEGDVRIEQGRFSRHIQLPRQGVELVVIEK
jgi:xylan 1,4-beta-xylosidase